MPEPTNKPVPFFCAPCISYYPPPGREVTGFKLENVSLTNGTANGNHLQVSALQATVKRGDVVAGAALIIMEGLPIFLSRRNRRLEAV